MQPYLQLLFGAITLAAIYAVFKSLLFNMHMFQLNGYRFSTHSHWIKKNIRHYGAEAVVFALSFTGLVRSEPLMGFCAAALLISVLALIPNNRRGEAKKPLVYTPRVKRMLFTAALLYLLSFAAAVYFLMGKFKNTAFLVIGLICALTPLFVPLANLINKPIEKGVNRHYTNEAKKLLAACPELETIGITGSYGKTSVKFYLYTILRAWCDTLVTPESYNTPMGVVKTVRGSLRAYHKIFLCEMGAKWRGDIKELCDIVQPIHGIITALGEQHLESFGSQENIIKTKYELCEALPENGRLYVNFDCELIRKNPPQRPFISYGTGEDCDYRACDISVSTEGTEFTVRAPNGEAVRFETKLLGEHNVLNITGAIAAAHGFKMPLAAMRPYVRRIEAVPHRMQIVKKGGVTIIDDAFNSNPAGCRAALSTLGKMEGVKILVTPGMVELGEKQAQLNREFGEFAAANCDYIALVGERQTVDIKEGAAGAGFNESRFICAESFAECMKKVYALKGGGKKIILLENDLPDNY